ncbi:MAG: polymer-forming cytoskeletal protein [Aureispira sp.]|nr:polymer-forming cytoskeletal protein [Aureispira sp.]
MFGFSKDSKVDSSNSLTHNSFIKATVIVGDIISESDVRLDCALEGNLECKAKVVIGVNGTVKGNVVCQNARIEGTVDGNVKVWELLDMRSTSIINGDIVANKLVVEDGAVFNGACQMGKQALKRLDNDKREASPKEVFRKKQKAG